MKIKLNATRSVRDRYYLIDGSMGDFGLPQTHANRTMYVVRGVDRGNGYQGCISVDHALTPASYMPEDAREALRQQLKVMGYDPVTLLREEKSDGHAVE